MDVILEKLDAFWAYTEVQLEVVSKKGQLAEQYLSFGHKPRYTYVPAECRDDDFCYEDIYGHDVYVVIVVMYIMCT